MTRNRRTSPRAKVAGGGQTYLLRIVRRGLSPDESLVGTVEEIGGEKRVTTFKTGKALIELLQREFVNSSEVCSHENK